MQKEPTDFLNLPRRGKILGVQNVTLYCKIDTLIQLFRWVQKWSLAQMLYKTLDPLFLYPIEPEISTPEKSAYCTRPFRTCRASQILHAAKDSCHLRPWLACQPASGASYCRCSQTLCYFSFFRVDMVTLIGVHLQSGDVSIYWLLYDSAVSVVIVIIVICDMPRQEFWLHECVYIHSTYM